MASVFAHPYYDYKSQEDYHDDEEEHGPILTNAYSFVIHFVFGLIIST